MEGREEGRVNLPLCINAPPPFCPSCVCRMSILMYTRRPSQRVLQRTRGCLSPRPALAPPPPPKTRSFRRTRSCPASAASPHRPSSLHTAELPAQPAQRSRPLLSTHHLAAPLPRNPAHTAVRARLRVLHSNSTTPSAPHADPLDSPRARPRSPSSAPLHPPCRNRRRRRPSSSNRRRSRKLKTGRSSSTSRKRTRGRRPRCVVPCPLALVGYDEAD
jgi:hypothetical protein